MIFSDEQIMAYADGEVDDDVRAQIDAALASDTQLAAQVAQHRALRQRLQVEFDAELTEPVPDRLLAALRAPTTNTASDNVVDLHARTSNKTTIARRNWSVREWGAMAATLVLGASLGVFTLNAARHDQNQNMLALSDGNLVAQGQLATALSEQLASAQSGAEPVQIGTSFNARSGDYCRTFALPTLAGLACHRGDAWRVQALTELKSSGVSNYRQAGSAMPAAIATLVDEEIADEPLDAQAEAQAQKSGWRH